MGFRLTAIDPTDARLPDEVKANLPTFVKLLVRARFAFAVQKYTAAMASKRRRKTNPVAPTFFDEEGEQLGYITGLLLIKLTVHNEGRKLTNEDLYFEVTRLFKVSDKPQDEATKKAHAQLKLLRAPFSDVSTLLNQLMKPDDNPPDELKPDMNEKWVTDVLGRAAHVKALMNNECTILWREPKKQGWEESAFTNPDDLTAMSTEYNFNTDAQRQEAFDNLFKSYIDVFRAGRAVDFNTLNPFGRFARDVKVCVWFHESIDADMRRRFTDKLKDDSSFGLKHNDYVTVLNEPPQPNGCLQVILRAGVADEQRARDREKWVQYVIIQELRTNADGHPGRVDLDGPWVAAGAPESDMEALKKRQVDVQRLVEKDGKLIVGGEFGKGNSDPVDGLLGIPRGLRKATKTVMHISASEAALELSTRKKLADDQRYEWAHIQAHSQGGADANDNLLCGREHSNSAMMVPEMMASWMLAQRDDEKKPEIINVTVLADLPLDDFTTRIAPETPDYRIVGDDAAAAGMPDGNPDSNASVSVSIELGESDPYVLPMRLAQKPSQWLRAVLSALQRSAIISPKVIKLQQLDSGADKDDGDGSDGDGSDGDGSDGDGSGGDGRDGGDNKPKTRLATREVGAEML